MLSAKLLAPSCVTTVCAAPEYTTQQGHAKRLTFAPGGDGDGSLEKHANPIELVHVLLCNPRLAIVISIPAIVMCDP